MAGRPIPNPSVAVTFEHLLRKNALLPDDKISEAGMEDRKRQGYF